MKKLKEVAEDAMREISSNNTKAKLIIYIGGTQVHEEQIDIVVNKAPVVHVTDDNIEISVPGGARKNIPKKDPHALVSIGLSPV